MIGLATLDNRYNHASPHINIFRKDTQFGLSTPNLSTLYDNQQIDNSANPVLVKVTRGNMIESIHRGAAAVTDANGSIIDEVGNIDNLIYPRSAIKPLQAIAFVESGAVKRFSLGLEEVALACASHSGEARHVDRVRAWLEKIGLDENNLECGAQQSACRTTREEMIRNRINPTAAYNNCSGKHAGFLSTAVVNGEPIKGYIHRQHPVQQRTFEILREMTEEQLSNAPTGLDGCGIPVFGMSLRGIARGFSKLASKRNNTDQQGLAVNLICSAMAKFPELVGGENRFCTFVSTATEGSILVKIGAEGVYAGMHLGVNPIGFALKIDDGARRAAEVAMGALILKHCKLDKTMAATLEQKIAIPVKTVAKHLAGVIEPSIELR